MFSPFSLTSESHTHFLDILTGRQNNNYGLSLCLFCVFAGTLFCLRYKKKSSRIKLTDIQNA